MGGENLEWNPQNTNAGLWESHMALVFPLDRDGRVGQSAPTLHRTTRVSSRLCLNDRHWGRVFNVMIRLLLYNYNVWFISCVYITNKRMELKARVRAVKFISGKRTSWRATVITQLSDENRKPCWFLAQRNTGCIFFHLSVIMSYFGGLRQTKTKLGLTNTTHNHTLYHDWNNAG